MDITLKINGAENWIIVMFVNSLQNQIKWFLANTWTETLTSFEKNPKNFPKMDEITQNSKTGIFGYFFGFFS